MLIDTHFHLTDSKFTNPQEVLDNSRKADIKKFVTVGTNLADNNQVISFVKKYSDLFGVVGIYPHEEIGKTNELLMQELEKQIKSSEKIVGVGECGIDINTPHQGRSVQEQKVIFDLQIKLALKYKLPLIVHNRNGDSEVLEILSMKENKDITGILHCFTSTWAFAKKLLDLNFYLSFSGIITYPSSLDIHETVRNVPLNRFVLETDAPYLAPQEIRKQPKIVNEPKYVRITAKKVAEIKGISLEMVEKAAYENSCTIFKFPA